MNNRASGEASDLERVRRGQKQTVPSDNQPVFPSGGHVGILGVGVSGAHELPGNGRLSESEEGWRKLCINWCFHDARTISVLLLQLRRPSSITA